MEIAHGRPEVCSVGHARDTRCSGLGRGRYSVFSAPTFAKTPILEVTTLSSGSGRHIPHRLRGQTRGRKQAKSLKIELWTLRIPAEHTSDRPWAMSTQPAINTTPPRRQPQATYRYFVISAPQSLPGSANLFFGGDGTLVAA